VKFAKITLFAGHYGSGKTNIAINYARAARPCAIADLDIVNPYFRTKDSAASLAADGITLVVSEYANSNVDFPALPKEIYALVAESRRLIIDVGGDDRGALALGRHVDDIRTGGDYEMLAVVNAARPLTRTPDAAIEVLREIEEACHLPFTGLVNNTNLGRDTTVEDVLASGSFVAEIARQMELPLRFTCCDERLFDALRPSFPEETLFPLSIQKLYYQMEES